MLRIKHETYLSQFEQIWMFLELKLFACFRNAAVTFEPNRHLQIS